MPYVIILVFARIIQGAGAAFMVSQVLTGIQLNLEGKSRTRAFTAYIVVLAGSAVVGQVLGGVLISANLFNAQWLPIFLINVPLGVLFLGIAVRFLPRDSQYRSQRLRLASVFGLAVFGTVYLGLVLQPDRFMAIHGFTVITILFAAAGLFATLAAFLSIYCRGAIRIAQNPAQTIES